MVSCARMQLMHTCTGLTGCAHNSCVHNPSDVHAHVCGVVWCGVGWGLVLLARRAAEQERLEELLVAYPAGGVQRERWKKIAAALGTRSVSQVQGRVQRFTKRLEEAGLPPP